MPKNPQDRRSKAETSTEPFKFTRDGETHELPPFASIKAGMLRRFRKLGDLDAAFSILEELADEDALAALDDLALDEFNDVVSDWMAHVGVSPGES